MRRVRGFTHAAYGGDNLKTVTESASSEEATKQMPVPKPLDVDGVSAVIFGIVAWAVALVVLLLFFRHSLSAHGATWWLWVCVAGIGLGLVALPYVLRRRAVYRRARSEPTEGRSTS